MRRKMILLIYVVIQKKNAALPQATKKDKRGYFYGKFHYGRMGKDSSGFFSNQMVTLAVESVGRLPINSCYGSGKM